MTIDKKYLQYIAESLASPVVELYALENFFAQADDPIETDEEYEALEAKFDAAFKELRVIISGVLGE